MLSASAGQLGAVELERLLHGKTVFNNTVRISKRMENIKCPDKLPAAVPGYGNPVHSTVVNAILQKMLPDSMIRYAEDALVRLKKRLQETAPDRDRSTFDENKKKLRP